MKWVLALGMLGALLGVTSLEAGSGRCPSGQVHGYVTIERDPPFLVGTIPSRFTDRQLFFSSRFNCRGIPPQVKRVDTGLYDVRFPNLFIHAASVAALSDEGVSASFWPLGNGIVRVALRGPLGGVDVATRRDVPFSLIVY